ncbi:F0F1 ATP synthase subunit B [Pelagibacteraceae bacterium]|jgi:F-type H+-transporting ATPase subunit b|nr:F0F1 ATP synthase subunit B [Pelagibacteraceae bacterium]|tara:strand:- start:433 stop:1011 length:579 start_codon:yes stop_codon:yes gene_type:complete
MKNLYFALCTAPLLYINKAYGSEAGMPQLNPEFWAAQVFWLILIFSILYFSVWKIFLPRIAYSIENRKSRIVNDLNDAEKLKENAEKKLKDYYQIIEKSKKEAITIIKDSSKKLDQDIEKKKKKLNEELEKELIATETEIKELKKSSLLNISKIAAETTPEIIKKIIGAEVNKSNVSAIVDEILKKNIEKRT